MSYTLACSTHSRRTPDQNGRLVLSPQLQYSSTSSHRLAGRFSSTLGFRAVPDHDVEESRTAVSAPVIYKSFTGSSAGLIIDIREFPAWFAGLCFVPSTLRSLHQAYDLDKGRM
jgi:hypothetical protein